MKIRPYNGIDDFRFDDDLETVKFKCRMFKTQLGHMTVLGKKFQTLHVSGLNMHIVFVDETGSEIESFEIFKGSLICSGVDLLNTDYYKLQAYFMELDDSLTIDENGFSSQKFGFSVHYGIMEGERSEYPESVVVFNRDYLRKVTPSVDEIIKHYLKK
ncbi:hypothetical protein DMA11_24055 [Marinilabiliaceae bacterium JC017]|nr:hypothetical protein DMA11_24055 [Marinilabiliaceae bacterium JC017]